MATITGKRFQMTDGAATPINLFPYTVSEAVYGLNNSISNAISSALSTISLSTYAGTSAIGSSVQPVYYNGSALVATDLSTTYAPYNSAGYLPLTGGTINGSIASPLTINTSAVSNYLFFNTSNVQKAFVGYYPTDGMVLGNYVTGNYLEVRDDGTIKYNNGSSGDKQVWWEGNDGSGSGLDADLLDGQHGSYYNNFLAYYDSGATSADSVTYPLSLLNVGTPSSAWWYVTTMYYAAVGSSAASQIATSYSESEPQMYIRQKQSTWTSWEEVYHSGNSNLSTVPWACSTLTASGDIHTDTRLTFNGMNIGWWDGVDNRIESANRPLLITSYSYPIYIGRNGEGNDIFIGTNGYVGINTTAPSYNFDVGGNAQVRNRLYFNSGDAFIAKTTVITGDGVAGEIGIFCSDAGGNWQKFRIWCSAMNVYGTLYTTGDQVISSDLTLKTNFKDVTYSVPDIAKCRAVTFDWKDGHGHSAGSIAQDWKPLIPELVHGEEGGMTLAYGQIALVNTIIEAREIERLKERVAELENQLKMRS